MNTPKELTMKLFTFLLFICAVQIGLAQDDDRGGPVTVTFTGPSTAIRLDYDYYYVNVSGGTHYSTTYSISGGSIISQQNGWVYVRWTSSGSSRWVRANVNTSGGMQTKYAYTNVTPAMPSAPSVSSNTCGNKTLTKPSTTSGETLYWQTSSGGTSTGSTNAASTYTKTSSGTVYLRARSNSGGYWSAARATSVTVNANPSTPSTPSVSSNTCGTKVLSRGNPPSGTTWYWQGTNSNGYSTSNSSSTYNVSSSGTYYIRARTSAGCWSGSRAVSVTVNGNPSTPSTPSVSQNCGNSVLTRGNPPGGTTWYWQGTNSSGTSTSNSSSTYTATSSGTYYIRARTSAGCWSGSRSVSVTVNPVPSLASGSNNSRCGTGSVTLTASPGSNGNNIRWYSASSGGSLLHTGTSYTTPSLSSNKTYYAASYNSSTGCTDPDRRAITAVINPISVGGSISRSTSSLCGSGTVNFSISGHAGTILRWQSRYKNGSGSYTGWSTVTETDNVTSINLPVSEWSGGARTYQVQAVVKNGSCSAVYPKQTVVVNPIPALASGSNNSRCGTGSVTLTASPGSNGNNIRWYSANSGGSFLHTGTSFTTPSLSSSNTYYAASYNSSTGCTDPDRKAITAVINPISVGGSISRSTSSLCGPGSVNFSISGHAGTILRWQSRYKNGSGNYGGWSTLTETDNVTSVNLPVSEWSGGARTYQVQAVIQNGSCSAVYPKQTVVVDPNPGEATGSSQSQCGTNSFTLSATPGSNGTTIRWYNSSSGGSPLHTGTSYSVSSLPVGTTTYYAESYNSTTQCYAQTRKAISATVYEVPTEATGSSQTSCGPNSFTLAATPQGAGNTIRWYDASTNGTLLHTGLTYPTGTLSNSTTYYAESYNSTTQCYAPTRKAITATVYLDPAVYSVTGTTSYCPEDGGASVELSGSELNVDYTLYRNGTGIATVPGNGGSLTFNNQIAGTYTIEAVGQVGSCPKTMSGNAVLTELTQPSVPTFANVDYGLDETVITRDNPPAGVTWYWQASASGKDESDFAPTKSVNSVGSYYLRAKSDEGCWGNASVVLIEAQEPVTVDISPISNESIQISWSGVSGNETGFKISRASSASGAYSEIHTAAGTDTEYTDTGLSTGTSYYYRVQAVVGSQVSVATQVATTTTSPEFNGDVTIVHAPVYNGNISAIRWKGYNDESEQVFTYGYDGLNRLKTAQYAAEAISTYERDRGYYSVPTINYDLNGNITGLTRQGLNPSNNPDIIDELTYTYSEASGNQLLNVSDARSTAGFSDGTNTGTDDDYAYDANGNMVKDLNKGIDTIYYNHLNLPSAVILTKEGSTDSLVYTYDAAGIKLQQKVYEGGSLVKTTDYVGGHIYENDDLKIIQHEEGRLTYDDFDQEWDYEYHLKDHLGNTRLTFTTAEDDPYQTIQDMESLNDDGVTPEQPTDFVNIPRINAPQANTTTGGNEVARLNAGETGVMIFFGVAKGDKVDFSVQANYDESQIGTFNLVSIAAGVILSDYNLGASAVGGEGLPSGSDNVINNAIADMTGGGGINKHSSNDAPLAYINYIYFNQDMTFNRAGFTQITTAANGSTTHELVTLDAGEMENAGYLLAYLTNESNEAVAVNFDDFTINHTPTKILQSDDYYPFGLTFNGYQRTASTKVRFKFQDQEHDDITGWDQFKWRNHQPDIGRFFNIDPLAHDYLHNSPYAFSENKVTSHIELEGLEALDVKVFSNPSNTSGRTVHGHGTPNHFQVDANGNVSNESVKVSNFSSVTRDKEFPEVNKKGTTTTTSFTLTGTSGKGSPLLSLFGNTGNESSFSITLTFVTDSNVSPNEDGSYDGATNGNLTIDASMKTGSETESGSIIITGSMRGTNEYGESVDVLNVDGSENEAANKTNVKFHSSEVYDNKSKPSAPFDSVTKLKKEKK